MATHSSPLAWKIPWMERPGKLQSIGLQSQTPLSKFTFFIFLQFIHLEQNESIGPNHADCARNLPKSIPFQEPESHSFCIYHVSFSSPQYTNQPCAQSCLTLCKPMDIAYWAPLSMGFPRQEYWSGLPFPTLGALPNPGNKPASLLSPALQADSLPLTGCRIT